MPSKDVGDEIRDPVPRAFAERPLSLSCKIALISLFLMFANNFRFSTSLAATEAMNSARCRCVDRSA